MTSADQASAPNVLFIITDQQRADHVGFMGNPVVRTPNLDALAEQGTVFENAWVANPVCMPNRCSLLTGRMPSAHGVIFNDRTLDWGANTIARQFAAAGYHTALIGKSHLQHGMSKNAVVPYRGSAAIRCDYPEGWDQIEDFERYLEGSPVDPEDFYGFKQIELSIDHGARASGHHLRWALEKGARYEDLVVEYADDAPGQHRSENWWQVYQPPYAEEYHSTRFVTDRTVETIRAAADSERPFFTWCSFPDPHHPLTPPGDWFFRHKPADMLLPESRHDALADAPEHLRVFSQVHPRDQRNWVAPCGYGDDALLAEAIAATYGMVEMIDHGVGSILSALDESGLADNTLVVFTSDHGDMMGDHGLFLKGFMHYRGTLQVPLVVRGPGVQTSRTRALASSLDLAPTLLDLAGLKPFDGMQGLSLSGVLQDSVASSRANTLIEDDVSEVTAKLTPIPWKTRTLVTERYRYTRNAKGEEQLFDLQEDPDEMHDLARRDPVARSAMVEQLLDALIAADDTARGAPATSN